MQRSRLASTQRTCVIHRLSASVRFCHPGFGHEARRHRPKSCGGPDTVPSLGELFRLWNTLSSEISRKCYPELRGLGTDTMIRGRRANFGLDKT